LNPSNCLNMNSDALVGYTCSMPKGPDAAIPIGIPPAGVMGIDTIAGVFTGEVGAPPGRRITGRVIRGRVRPAGPPSAAGVASGGVGMVTSRCMGHVVALDVIERRGHVVWKTQRCWSSVLSTVVGWPRFVLQWGDWSYRSRSTTQTHTQTHRLTDTRRLGSHSAQLANTRLQLRSHYLSLTLGAVLVVSVIVGRWKHVKHAERATYLLHTNCHDQSRCQTKPRAIIAED
jgi:hypothetical protein